MHQGPEERKVCPETSAFGENRVCMDFQASKGLKVRREISLLWILKVRKETGVSQAPQADKDSQGEEELMGSQEPLETPDPRAKVFPVLLEIEATQDSQGQRD